MLVFFHIEVNWACPNGHSKIPKRHRKVASYFHDSSTHFSTQTFSHRNVPVSCFIQTLDMIICRHFVHKKLNKTNKKTDSWNMNKQLRTLLWGADNFSIRMVTDVLHHVLQSQPGLRGCRDDLIGRKDEAVATGVPELKGERVLDAEVVRPVDAAATGLVCRKKPEGGKTLTGTTRQQRKSLKSNTIITVLGYEFAF